MDIEKLRGLLKDILEKINNGPWKDNKVLCTCLKTIIENIDRIGESDIKIVAEIIETLYHLYGSENKAHLIDTAIQLATSLIEKYNFEKVPEDEKVLEVEPKEKGQLEEYNSSSKLVQAYLRMREQLHYSYIEYIQNYRRLLGMMVPIELPNVFNTAYEVATDLLKTIEEALEKDPEDKNYVPRMKDTGKLIDTMFKLLNSENPEDLVKYNDSLCEQIDFLNRWYINLGEALDI